MEIGRQEIENILASMPYTQENSGVIAELEGLLAASRIVKRPYVYSAIFWTTGAANNIAAGATSPQVLVNVDAAAPFLVTSQTYDANTANAARTASNRVVPNATVTIQETGTGLFWSEQAIIIPAWFGTGEFPFVLPEPKIVQSNSNLAVIITNIDAAAGYNIRLNFIGYRLHKMG